MVRVDVVMLTKNSDELLERCLDSIYENVPVNNLIVVDSYSTDHTVRILEKYKEKHGNVKIFFDEGTRAQCRELGINKVSTEWFMFVDSDVILCKDWFKIAWSQIDDDVGCVWGLDLDVGGKVGGIAMRFFIAVAYLSFKLRGGTHDTLIKTKLVRGMIIPPQLHTYEDAYIMKWLKKKGCRILIGKRMYCLHIKPDTDWNLKQTVKSILSELKCSLALSHTFKYSVYFPVYGFYWIIHWLFLNRKKH